MSLLEFSKYQGLGNDFLIIDSRNRDLPTNLLTNKVVQRICDRKFGLGGDGIIIVLPSKISDLRMKIINSDGTEPEMCGNGIRCLVKYLIDNSGNLNGIRSFKIETLAGIIKAVYKGDSLISVDMGKPVLDPKDIPTNLSIGKYQMPNGIIYENGKEFKIYAVGMGNPHLITFIDSIKETSIEEYGKSFEYNKYFPQRTNVHFIKLIDQNNIEMYTWERGCGLTFACGTGACASVVASKLLGFCSSNVRVKLFGGTLIINWEGIDSSVNMTGIAKRVYSGQLDLMDII